MQIIALPHPLFSSPPNQLEPVKNLGNAVLLWIFGLAKARARKGVVQPAGSLFSRPCTSAGGVVASSAVNASRIL